MSITNLFSIQSKAHTQRHSVKASDARPGKFVKNLLYSLFTFIFKTKGNFITGNSSWQLVQFVLAKYSNLALSNNNNKISDHEEKLIPRSRLLFIIFSALIFIFVVYYFSQIETEVKLLEKVNVYWLAAALIAQFATYFFTALLYRFLLGAHKLQHLPGLWNLLKASIISLFFNQTVPSAGISGNTYFFNFLGKLNIRVSQILSVILAELLIFYAAMEVIIIFLLLACLTIYKVPHIFTGTLWAGLAVYLVFGTLISLAGRKRFIDRLYNKIQKVKFIKRIFQKEIQNIRQQGLSKKEVNLLIFLNSDKKVVVKVFLFQLLVVASDGFTLYALFWGLGIPVSPFVVLLSLIGTRIISILPFLPGALILFESSMSFFFVSLGVPLAIAIIVTLLFRLLSFWFPIPIGLFLYRRWLHKAPDPDNSSPAV
ncbi:MAG TPA: lysylphosphatidylglycerol synthase transmembrane domain-containing protein [Hanamia sp.]